MMLVILVLLSLSSAITAEPEITDTILGGKGNFDKNALSNVVRELSSTNGRKGENLSSKDRPLGLGKVVSKNSPLGLDEVTSKNSPLGLGKITSKNNPLELQNNLPLINNLPRSRQSGPTNNIFRLLMPQHDPSGQGKSPLKNNFLDHILPKGDNIRPRNGEGSRSKFPNFVSRNWGKVFERSDNEEEYEDLGDFMDAFLDALSESVPDLADDLNEIFKNHFEGMIDVNRDALDINRDAADDLQDALDRFLDQQLTLNDFFNAFINTFFDIDDDDSD